MECRRALESSNGNMDEAAKLLHQQGMQKAAKKSDRSTGEGQIGNYIHFGGKIGVLVEVNCETDFVARTADFQQFIKDIAMHVAAINPKYLSKEDVPQEVLQEELEIYKKQARESGKPDNIVEKIAQGKLDKFYKSVCLMEQSFIKDENKTISDILTETVAKLGENIKISRFVRFEVGQ